MNIKTTDYGLCTVIKNSYGNNGNLRLSLIDDTGCPITHISTNIIPLMDNQFCANIFNIGATLWNDIISSGFFEETGDDVQSGYCEFPIYKLVNEA